MVYANLKAEIVKHNISYESLAALMNIKKEVLIEKIHGVKDFSLNEIEIILKTFSNCKYEYLFKRTNDF